jgi:O-methyltransferase
MACLDNDRYEIFLVLDYSWSEMKLLSDQVDEREIEIILRELQHVFDSQVLGDVVEFGCYVGTTSVYLARQLTGTNRQLYLYDSFDGLPPKTAEDNSLAGDQFQKGQLLAAKSQLIANLRQAHVPMPHIKKAWFKDLEINDVPDNIAFAFLDGDYYQSIRDSLKLITPRLSPGAIIVVDDYASEALPGAARAVNQWLKDYPLAKLQVEHSLAIIKGRVNAQKTNSNFQKFGKS